MVSVESKGEKRMVNSKYYQGLEQDCIVKDDTRTIHLSSYGSHLVNKIVKLVVGRTHLVEVKSTESQESQEDKSS